DCDAFGVDRSHCVRKYPTTIKERLSHCRIGGNYRENVATYVGRRPRRPRSSRRTLLKASAAFAGASTIGFPAIVSAQAARIKIGHLVPLTGFLGAIGSYAQLGVKMAAEEINASGGIMGKQIDLMSEDS